jgi:hypothetical protein
MASMAVQITIRDLPDSVRDALRSRAKLAGKSLQAYLREELVRLAARPTLDRWLQQVRERKRKTRRRLRARDILAHRDADRR